MQNNGCMTFSINKKEFLEQVLKAKDTTYLTHNFHPYPAKFIPQIPNYMIKLFTKKPEDLVLDPFCGSGTTLVEAKLLNRKSIGFDSHPIAVLMSKVKTTKLSNEELNKIPFICKKIENRINNFYKKFGGKKTLLSFTKNLLSEDNFSYSIPDFLNKDHWFQKHVQHELAIIKTSISEEEISDSLKNFLLLAFSNIIVPVSNQESETRYASIIKRIAPKQAFNLFKNHVTEMVERIKEFNTKASDIETKVEIADSRYLDHTKIEKVSLIVTSPPYPNTYDYYLYHKFRLFWLGYDVKKVQSEEIGSRNKHSSKKESIESYIRDMTKCFECFNKILGANKFFVIVVGDAIIDGKLSKGDEVIKEIAKETNFKFMDKISYNLTLVSRLFNPAFRNTSKEEHIIFLKNEK